MKLYIIGNGFDLYHGIKSSFWNFKDYVEENHSDLYERIEQFLGGDDFWSDFESYLGDIDEEEIRDRAETFLMDYGAEDWSDAGHHDYQYEISQITDDICEGITSALLEWIMQLTIAQTQNDAISLPVDALYLTFNYTDTLERLYRINSMNIKYIHNKAVDNSSILVYGHNRIKEPSKTDAEIISDINTAREEALTDAEIQEILDDIHSGDDPRVTEGEEIIREYYRTTYKPVNEIIERNQDFFNQLSDFEEIYVLGHSLNEIDLPYFKLIREKVGGGITWNVSYYCDEERTRHQSRLYSIGVSETQMNFIRISDLSIELKIDFTANAH